MSDTVKIVIEQQLGNGAKYTGEHTWTEVPNEQANVMVISAAQALAQTAQGWADAKAGQGQTPNR